MCSLLVALCDKVGGGCPEGRCDNGWSGNDCQTGKCVRSWWLYVIRSVVVSLVRDGTTGGLEMIVKLVSVFAVGGSM